MDEADEVARMDQTWWTLVQDVWTTGVFGVELGRILLALAIFLFFLALRHGIGRIFSLWIRKLVQRTKTDLDDKLVDAIQEPLAFTPIALGFFISVETLGLSGVAKEIAEHISRSLIVILLFWALIQLVQPVAALARRLEQVLSAELVEWMLKAARIALWLIGGATILEIWGVRVAPIIAGFGLIGVAVALGAQDLFKNLISGILILVEKRFRVGDWVKVEGVVEGTVEAISFRSTKVRRFDKAPVYIPNARFADGAVINFGEMTHRRIYWSIGLEYRSTAAQLSAIRDAVERYILDDQRFLHPPHATAFVRLDRYSDSSIDLLIYCFTKTRDWGEWLKIKEEFLLHVKQVVEDAGSGFAFPSQSVYLERAPGGGMDDFGAAERVALPAETPAPRRRASKSVAAEAAETVAEAPPKPAKPRAPRKRAPTKKTAAPPSGS